MVETGAGVPGYSGGLAALMVLFRIRGSNPDQSQKKPDMGQSHVWFTEDRKT